MDDTHGSFKSESRRGKAERRRIMKYLVATMLVIASLLSAAFAIWAKEMRDYQLKIILRDFDRNGSISSLQRKVVSRPSYVFSFRIAGGVGALFLLVLAVEVMINN